MMSHLMVDCERKRERERERERRERERDWLCANLLSACLYTERKPNVIASLY